MTPPKDRGPRHFCVSAPNGQGRFPREWGQPTGRGRGLTLSAHLQLALEPLAVIPG